MIDYLIRSRARRRLLGLLWRRGESGSVSELAERAGLNFQSAHKELNEMYRTGLARRSTVGNATVFEARTEHPQGKVLRDLLRVGKRGMGVRGPTTKEDEKLRSWLKAWGAPVVAPWNSEPPPALEKVLVLGARLAHSDASVARSLPVCVWVNRGRLDARRLRREAQREGEKQALGFFLALTGLLGRDQNLSKMAETLRDRRVRKTSDFFLGPTSPQEQELAEARTPSVAREWHFRMNMSMETFTGTFGKFAHEVQVSR